MHFNNKFINIILLVLVFLSVNVNALVSSPTNGFVTDNANVLKDDTEEYINRYSQFLYENTKVDFYVVILKSLEDYDLALYTDYIYDNFQLNDRGILIVGSSNDRIIRIKVGEKLSYFISDEIIDEYISNYFMPYLKNGEWDKGILNGYKAFYKMLCNIYSIDSSEMIVYDGLSFINKYKNFILMFVVWLNTIISYIFCDYFIRIFMRKDYKNTIVDTLVFGLCLFINILMFILAYIVNPLSIILVLASEVFSIYSNYTSNKLVKSVVKKTAPKKVVVKNAPKSIKIKKKKRKK